ncbi:MAG: Flp pilus assembly protein TadG [Psychromonas sp.]|jgi:Flp pilus assembly protein TadG|uniref:TadE/TadG family type IV pilus assembly protein n=1 Tax=Psychromonas sp. TaxID=1884585 RepID=UPI0039E34DFB
MIYRSKQKGVYAVEFAIVGSLFFVLFFAVIEFARVIFTWDVLTEVSRRGARLATVCHVQRQSTDLTSPDFRLIGAAATPNEVLTAAIFSDADYDAKMIPNLTPENIKISYLDYAGNTASTFAQISLVRAEIVNYSHQLLIPFFSITLNSPSFSTTLLRESLGVTRYGYTCNGTPL